MQQSKSLLIEHYAITYTEVELKIIGLNKDMIITIDRAEKQTSVERFVEKSISRSRLKI